MSSVALRFPAAKNRNPVTDTFLADVLAGLRRPLKSIPCKYFYDAEGSLLFDRICELDDYYPTRTEIDIMRRNIDEIAACLGEDCLLIEYGSGSSLKTRILIENLIRLEGYIPIDISNEHLMLSTTRLTEAYPGLRIYPIWADYTSDHFMVESIPGEEGHRVIYFPGSTIGNFDPVDARSFLRRMATVAGNGGGLLIGVDLKKDKTILESAYDDSEGVTSSFNLNLLRRINRELNATFRLDRFQHRAWYNETLGRVEMHLVSLSDQSVRVGEETFFFRKGEWVHTENSYKYNLDDFAELAGSAGFEVNRIWTDPKNWFSIQYLTVK